MKSTNKGDNILKRIIASLSIGYILFFFSEVLFWARFKPDDTLPALITTWLIYSLVTYLILIVIEKFKVKNIWALFLTGALFGWIVEGVIVQTMYDNLPFSISNTGLSWHAIISVMIGFFYIKKILSENKYLKTILISILIGLIYGFWAIRWPVETGIVVPILEFALYSLIGSFFFIIAHVIYSKLKLYSFKATKIETWALLIIGILYYVFITIPTQILSLVILPPLIALTIFALKRNKDKEETEQNTIISTKGKAKFLNYLCILFLPITAIIFYGLTYQNYVTLNILSIGIYLIVMPLGFVMFIISLIKIFRKKY